MMDTDGAKNTTEKAAAQSTRTNGQSDAREMDGQNGATSGTKTSTYMGMERSREKHGGKESMVMNGTAHGERNTMALVGSTSTAEAAVANIGTHMLTRKHGMRGTLTLGLIIAFRTLRVCAMFATHHHINL